MSISLQKLKKRAPPKGDEKPAKKLAGRFNGLSEEEVAKNTLQDYLRPNLDLVFLGINPSLMAAHTGRYYAGPGNHFYKLLYESKLIPEPITSEHDHKLLEHDIGLTNIVARATRSSADLSRSELKKGAMIVQDKLKEFKPKIAVFNGKCIWEEFVEKYDKKAFCFGLQPNKVGDTALWVVPSSSARCANFPRMQDKLHFYTSLKKYLLFLKGEIKEVDPEEFRFEGKCKQAVPSTSKMWRRKGLSMFANGGRVVNKETVCMDTSEENILAIPRSTEFIIKNTKEKEHSDSEKDSGVSESQSDCSQKSSQDNVKMNENETVQENENETVQENENSSTKASNLLPKKRAPKRKANEKVQTRIAANIQQKERTETIDFVSLIKQRLSNKEQEKHENDEEDSIDDEALTQTDEEPVKGLKYSNLSSNKSKSGFIVKTIDDVEHCD